jgi:broad specificity phosphatase PhoE
MCYYVSIQVLIIGHQGILRILYGYLMWTEIQVFFYPTLFFNP